MIKMKNMEYQSGFIFTAHVKGKRYVTTTNSEEFLMLTRRMHFNRGKRLERNYHPQIKYAVLTRLKALLTGDNRLINEIIDTDKMNDDNAIEQMNERTVLKKMKKRGNH
jgi:hypothetical protein